MQGAHARLQREIFGCRQDGKFMVSRARQQPSSGAPRGALTTRSHDLTVVRLRWWLVSDQLNLVQHLTDTDNDCRASACWMVKSPGLSTRRLSAPMKAGSFCPRGSIMDQGLI